MTSTTPPHIEDLAELTDGDIITVPDRDTPMTVQAVDERAIGGVTVTARNQYTRYRLQQHNDNSISLRARDTVISRDTTVKRTGRGGPNE